MPSSKKHITLDQFEFSADLNPEEVLKSFSVLIRGCSNSIEGWTKILKNPEFQEEHAEDIESILSVVSTMHVIIGKVNTYLEERGKNVSVKQQIDALTNDFFTAVSFVEGEKPAYQNLRDIFISSGLLIRNISTSPDIATVEQFIAPRQKMVDSGDLTAFREAELSEITEIFGNVAHRFSTYEKSGVNKGVTIAGRGIISIQFINTEAGWKMSSMAWDDEREGLTIPERYK